MFRSGSKTTIIDNIFKTFYFSFQMLKAHQFKSRFGSARSTSKVTICLISSPLCEHITIIYICDANANLSFSKDSFSNIKWLTWAFAAPEFRYFSSNATIPRTDYSSLKSKRSQTLTRLKLENDWGRFTVLIATTHLRAKLREDVDQ